MSGDREKLERLAYEAQMLEQQRQMIMQRIMQSQESAAQLGAAIESIRGMGKEPMKTLVPIGAGAMLPAKAEAGKVLMDVGAGVVMEMAPEGAISLLESRLKKVSNFQAVAELDAQKTVQMLQRIDQEARSLMAQMKTAHPEE